MTSILSLVCLTFAFVLTGCSGETGSRLSSLGSQFLSPSSLSSTEDIDLRGDGWDYTFTYKDEDYNAEFNGDTWTIYNSYRIRNAQDILTICKALSEEHSVPSADGESYRTPQDMAFEWQQHNLAYEQLPEGNPWRESARNVDLDPDDQGKTFKEIYEERTGRKLDLDTVIEHSDKIREKAEEKLGEDNIDFNTVIEKSDKLKEKAKEKLEGSHIDPDNLDLDRIKEKIKEKLRKHPDDE